MTMRYSCSGCIFSSGRKCNIETHILRKNKCCENPKLIDTPLTNCKYCNNSIKTITKIDHIEEHLKVCEKYLNKITLSQTLTELLTPIDTIPSTELHMKNIMSEDCILSQIINTDKNKIKRITISYK